TRRWQVRTTASQLVQDVHRAHYALYETWDQETHVKLEPSGAPIVARLEQTRLRATSHGTDPRRSMLRALCPGPDDYWMASNRRAIPEQMIPFADLLPVVDDNDPGDAAA